MSPLSPNIREYPPGVRLYASFYASLNILIACQEEAVSTQYREGIAALT